MYFSDARHKIKLKKNVQALPGFNKQQPSTTICLSCEDKHPAIVHCHDCRENLCETCVRAHKRVRMTKSHHITNGIVQAPPGFNKQQTSTTKICFSCEDKPPAIAHCHDCRENLCETCVGAHRRVSLTKAHHITMDQAPPGFNKQQTTATICSSCEDKPPAIAHCHDCKENLCETCVRAHKHVSMTKSHHITNLLLHGVAGPPRATLESLRTSNAMTHQASHILPRAGKNTFDK